MKGFIAATIALAPDFADRVINRPVHFAFTYDEETGCLGANELVKHLVNREDRPALAIIGEPTQMRLIEGHKGCFEYSTHFCGREGHGSLPDHGVNAVEYAVQYVTRLLELREELKSRSPSDCRFDPSIQHHKCRWAAWRGGPQRDTGESHSRLGNASGSDQ